MTLRRRSYDITSTCPTIRMTSLRFRDDTDATEEIRIPHMLYLIFLYHPGYHGSIAGLHGSNFVSYEIYHVGDSAHCRINFAWKGILVAYSKVILTGYFEFVRVGNHWSRAWDKNSKLMMIWGTNSSYGLPLLTKGTWGGGGAIAKFQLLGRRTDLY
jgi:hypothetical protein